MKYVICLSLLLGACTTKIDQQVIKVPAGHSSLFGFLPDNSSCVNGGSLITMGLDINDNTVLDLEEIQYSTNVCNGAAGGATGPAGADGTNGVDGSDGAVGPSGATGATGSIGPQGPSGAVCTFISAHHGFIIQCPNGTSQFVSTQGHDHDHDDDND